VTPPRQPLAVVIHRGGHTRKLCSFYDEVLPRLQSLLPLYRTVIYFGNESVADTIQLFVHASFVIGYHGAGHANAIFSPDSAVVIEFAFQHPVLKSEIYYAQVELLCRHHPGLHCFTIGLNPADSFNVSELGLLRELYNKSGLAAWGNPGFFHLHNHINCINVTSETIQRTVDTVHQWLAPT
jgi:hypothetical protein